jgi:hypothetical protein
MIGMRNKKKKQEKFGLFNQENLTRTFDILFSILEIIERKHNSAIKIVCNLLKLD